MQIQRLLVTMTNISKDLFLKGTFTILITVFLVSGCATTSESKTVRVLDGRVESAPKEFLGLPLANGQLVVSDTGGALSLFFTLFAEDFYPFVHAGIVVIEDGQPYVIEAVGNYFPGFGDTPTTSVIGGGVLKTPLKKLVRRQRYVEIYEAPASVDRDKLVAFAKEQVARKPKFDPFFDYTEHDKLYCTEFVALALEAAGHPKIRPIPNKQNDSLEVVLNWLKIESRETVLAGSLVSDSQYVGTLSTMPTRRKMRVYNELKRELHTRFSKEQKLGNIFRIEKTTVKFRDPVYQFLDRGLNLFDLQVEEPRTETVRVGVQRLADEMFGKLHTRSSSYRLSDRGSTRKSKTVD